MKKGFLIMICLAVNWSLAFSQGGLVNSGGAIVVGSGANVVIQGDYLNKSSGVVDLNGGGVLALTGDWNNESSGGVLVNPATADGEVKFIGNGSAVQYIVNPAGVVSTFEKLTVASGAAVEVPYNAAVTAYGDFTANGQFLLKSPNDNGSSASLITYGTVSGSGCEAERYFTEGYHYISTPVDVTLVSDFGGILDEHYDANDSWIVPTTINMIVGQGYRYYGSSASNFRFSGVYNSGTQNPSIYTTGWLPNVLGNPYPSSLDWEQVYASNSASFGSVVTYRDYNNGDQRNATYNAATKVSANGGTQFVPSMQGFSVTPVVDNAIMTLNNSMRCHSTQNYWKSAPEAKNTLRLIAEGGSHKGDETLIMFRDDASVDFDGLYDAYKLFEPEAHFCHLYSQFIEEKPMTINTVTERNAVPLYFSATKSGDYTIRAVDIQFDKYNTVYLKDLKTNTIVDLSNEDYSFKHDGAVKVREFMVLFSTEGETLVDVLESGEMNIYSYQRDVYVNSNIIDSGYEVEVFDILGQKVLHEKVSQSGVARFAVHGASGTYVVKATCGKKTVVRKVYIAE